MASPVPFREFAEHWLPRVEAEMQEVLRCPDPMLAGHYRMMHYHMGWLDEQFRPGRFPTGKRIRPLLCLLACQEVGGQPEDALPAAAALEIFHNFSLIHDDIEDQDATRRHRPTLWALWGTAQAINVGDGMFALAYMALLRLAQRGLEPSRLLSIVERFTRTAVALAEGQHLDLGFERRDRVTVEEYLRMIQGKTASLLAASLAIGAAVGGADPGAQEALSRFGHNLGMAFQIRDDILGIWGDPTVTGKPAGSDVLRRKKSLPLLYALAHPEVGPVLQSRWTRALGPEDMPEILELLDQAGARTYAEETLRGFHRAGIQALEEALGIRASTSPLMALADELVERVA